MPRPSTLVNRGSMLRHQRRMPLAQGTFNKLECTHYPDANNTLASQTSRSGSECRQADVERSCRMNPQALHALHSEWSASFSDVTHPQESRTML